MTTQMFEIPSLLKGAYGFVEFRVEEGQLSRQLELGIEEETAAEIIFLWHQYATIDSTGMTADAKELKNSILANFSVSHI